MNKLNSLHITNFRSCIDTKLDFYKNLTALIGINGAGKTNILNSLVILNQLDAYRRHISSKSVAERTPTTIELKLEVDNELIAIKVDIYLETSEAAESVSYFQAYYKQGGATKWAKIENVFFRYGSYIYRYGVKLPFPATLVLNLAPQF